MAKDANAVIKKYLADMHALERHGLQAVSRQAEQLQDAKHADALRAVQGFQATLESHVAALDQRLKALGGSADRPVQDTVAAMAGVVAGIYNAVRSEEASKSIRDDYTFFSHSAIAYLMLHTTTEALGDQESAALAETGYRDMARMVMEIDHLMPGLVIAELRQDELPVSDVQDHCRQLVSDAWKTAPSSVATSVGP
jgi:ferritin-like metal-binding protein YciE